MLSRVTELPETFRACVFWVNNFKSLERKIWLTSLKSGNHPWISPPEVSTSLSLSHTHTHTHRHTYVSKNVSVVGDSGNYAPSWTSTFMINTNYVLGNAVSLATYPQNTVWLHLNARKVWGSISQCQRGVLLWSMKRFWVAEAHKQQRKRLNKKKKQNN